MDERYFETLAVAYIRGEAAKQQVRLPGLATPLDQLSPAEKEQLFTWGKTQHLKLYPFKNTHDTLPRVKKVISFCKSIQMESLLDVGSGRGVFLFPFLETFPWVEVTSLDILPERVAFLDTLRQGGIAQLAPMEGNLCTQPFPDNSFDVVTLLEVLEHIPAVEQAVQAAVAMSKRYIIVTVPSKEDDNPEHIHLLTQEVLTDLFHRAGCHKLRFDGVHNHLVLIATKE